MPTGYTAAIIEKHCTFEQFVWSCARAFGALVNMRDEPSSAIVPQQFTASPYHLERMHAATAELKRLLDMSIDEATERARVEYEQAMFDYKKRDYTMVDECATYQRMLEKVEAWEVPSSDHASLKVFMIEQIHQSLKHDCTPLEMQPTPMTGEAWLAAKREAAFQSVTYHEAEYAKAVARIAERNTWIRQLRESVPQPVLTA